jgi:excisionase family DNA binding protein
MKAAILDTANQVWIQKSPAKQYYTVLEVSHLLTMGTPQVYAAIRSGKIEGVMLGNLTAISHEALLAYIERRSTSGAVTELLSSPLDAKPVATPTG